MATVFVGVLALVGVLTQTFFPAGEASRERRSLKAETDLLNALPEDMRPPLRRHLELRLNEYLASEKTAPEKRSGAWALVLTLGAIVLILVGMLMGVGVDWAPTWGIKSRSQQRALGITLIVAGYLLTPFISTQVNRWRLARKRRQLREA